MVTRQPTQPNQIRQQINYRELIAAVERADLEVRSSSQQESQLAPVRIHESADDGLTWKGQVSSSSGSHVTALSLFRISGMSFPDSRESLNPVGEYVAEALAGLHGQNIRVVYLITSAATGINVWLGAIGQARDDATATQIAHLSTQSVQSIMTGFFPDIEVTQTSHALQEICSLRTLMRESRFYGFTVGVPTPVILRRNQRPEQMERVVRGLYGQSFGIMVIAEPVQNLHTAEAFNHLMEEIKEHHGNIKISTQRQKSTAIATSAEEIDRYAQHYVSLLEQGSKRLEEGKAIGIWRTGVYFFSPNSRTFNKLRALLQATFAGRKSRPQPLRSLSFTNITEAKGHIDGFQQLVNKRPTDSAGALVRFNCYSHLTQLTSRELATYLRPPITEFPGFRVSVVPDYGVDLPSRRKGTHIIFGEVLQGRTLTGNQFSIPVEDLSRHVLVTGVTGSGKTNTCMEVLAQLWTEMSKPFLVIEPAKSEYRELITMKTLGDDLQVFTLGDERTAPFRMNPFEILEGTLVQTHIDLLKSVFNACFIMYSPMPYVLEQCLHEIYEDKGWDLLTGRNCHDTGRLKDKAGLYPTLTELFRKVEPVVSRLGYEQRITMDVRAGLKTRLNSLRIGGKGTMLDCRQSTPIELLLSKPTVIELKRIGDDEEKAFLIGLLLIRLYEYLEGKSQRSRFSHLTVIEEAHRLLANVSTDSSNLESASTRGKSLETFCNILSEIRAYGEGMMIVDQIPVKLAPDAIKNTNLKILHRMVAKDDCEAVGYTMNMDEGQIRHVSTIDRGVAATFAEGMDKPVMVRVNSFKEKHLRVDRAFEDSDIQKHMQSFYTNHPSILGQYYGCRYCQSRCSYLHLAKRLTDELSSRRAFYRLFIQMLIKPGILAEAFTSFVQMLNSVMRERSLDKMTTKGYALCVGLQMCLYYIQLRRDQYGLGWVDMEAFERRLADLFSKVVGLYMEKKLSDIARELEKPATNFVKAYRQALRLQKGPFAGCQVCSDKCVFRYELSPLVYSKRWRSEFDKALDKKDSSTALWEHCFEAARNIAPLVPESLLKAPATCYLVQQAADVGVRDQYKLVKRVMEQWS